MIIGIFLGSYLSGVIVGNSIHNAPFGPGVYAG
jgi:hypothetical protein